MWGRGVWGVGTKQKGIRQVLAVSRRVIEKLICEPDIRAKEEDLAS